MFFFETLLYNKDKPILIGEIRYNYVPFAKVSHDLVTIIHSTITNRYIKTIYIANGNIIHSETTHDMKYGSDVLQLSGTDPGISNGGANSF